jgi:uncharacterized protein YodC (DUF2158 family)
MKTLDEINVGDVVRVHGLASPAMVVNRKDVPTKIECVWFVNHQLQIATFDLHVLEHNSSG